MKLYNNRYINSIIDKIVENDGFEKNFKYHYLYIIYHIRTYAYKDRTYKHGDPVPVNVKTLRKMISYNNTIQFLDNLVQYGLIETDGGFSRVAKVSRKYRLTNKCYNDKFYLEECKDEKLSAKIDSIYTKIANKIKDRGDGYGHVTRCMENLEIDEHKAINYIKLQKLDTLQKDCYEIMAEVFKTKFVTIDNTANRLHNNLTNLYTPLRSFLSYNGQKIVQCDLRNSQLVFLYTMLHEYTIPKAELDKFGIIVCEYGFYEFFADKLNRELTEENRKQFKTEIFQGVLFGSNKSKLTETEEILQKEFPTILHIIRRIKTDNYKSLSIKLQNEESKFIFECIEKIGYDIPLLTIHDSIATTVGNEEIIKKAMLDLFIEKYKIIPKIKVEKF